MMSEETCLADLLALNLHKFEDEVRNIVDKATKELSMEKTLKELDVTWVQMEFDHEPHHRTGIMLINASEELIETLEDNQVSAGVDHHTIKFYTSGASYTCLYIHVGKVGTLNVLYKIVLVCL